MSQPHRPESLPLARCSLGVRLAFSGSRGRLFLVLQADDPFQHVVDRDVGRGGDEDLPASLVNGAAYQFRHRRGLALYSKEGAKR